MLGVTAAAGRTAGAAGSTGEENMAYNVTVTEPDGSVSTQTMPVAALPPSSSIWSDYDQRVYIIVAAQNPAAEAQTQVRCPAHRGEPHCCYQTWNWVIFCDQVVRRPS